MKPSGFKLLFCGEFVLYFSDSISFLVIGLSRFSISHSFSHGRVYVSKNSSISSVFSNLLVYNTLYQGLFFFLLHLCGFSCNFYLFLILFIWVISFRVLSKVHQFCFLFEKKKLLVLLIFQIVFLVSISQNLRHTEKAILKEAIRKEAILF